MTTDRMTCMSCSRTKAYPDGFPDRAFAECWDCAWDSHIRKQHPEVARRIKRAAKKRARRIKESDVYAAMFAHERRQVLTTTTHAEDTEATTTEETL